MPPLTAQQAIALALRHHQAGRLAQAEAIYRQVLQEQPDHADAVHYLGLAAEQSGRSEEGLELIRRSIELLPMAGGYHNNLGNALHRLGRLDEALAAYRRTAELEPSNALAWRNQGAVLAAMGSLPQAVVALDRAIELDAKDAQTHLKRGVVLTRLGRLPEALETLRQALLIKPDLADAHAQVGIVLQRLGQLAEAAAACRKAIELDPNNHEAHRELGRVLHLQGELQEAIASYDSAIAVRPAPETRRLRALSLIAAGDYARGWAEYESRLEIENRPTPRFTQPRWDGSPLAGRRILLWAEQGLGDTIQFVRYAPLVTQRGGKVVLRCQPGLKKLLQGLDGVEQVLADDEPPPQFDVHASLMSLPFIFRTEVASVPARVPYLRPPPDLVAWWRAKLGPVDGNLRVGLCWAGGAGNDRDADRSMSFATLAPLAEIRNVTFYNLQKGPAAEQLGNPPPGLKILDLPGANEDMLNTAALVSNLDLVLAVDTAVAHLAGALAKPVWMLLCFVPDWRWMLDRPDTPWYPTMQLFRQRRDDDWEVVVTNAVSALRQKPETQSPYTA